MSVRVSEPQARRRRAGVLLHPTSLPAAHGIGDLGPAARRFVETLSAAGQQVWQVLPLAPTGYGDSPYQALSAFAGNPLLLSLEDLCVEGWLDHADLADAPRFLPGTVDYDLVSGWKTARVRRAAERFEARASPSAKAEREAFRLREAGWLDDVALFLAVKDRHGGVSWTDWPADLREREPGVLRAARRELAEAIDAHVFAQWAFDRQWTRLRSYAVTHGVALMGDVPIYVAHDSAEVWARRQLFQLDDEGFPRAVSGVPPDYFSATGQLWGSPLHDWKMQAEDGYAFWIARMRHTLRLYDLVRLDHFRGFEAYWAVPAGSTTALTGRWERGPGAELFEAMEDALGSLPVVAENLGVITPEVEALRRRFGYPGMAILQFAFGKDPQAESFKPYSYGRDTVAYTGTHDNDTVVGWWKSGAGPGSTRTAADVEQERARAEAHLWLEGRPIHWSMVRELYASVAELVITPLQDLLGLGSEARMNTPATTSGNWRWRFLPDAPAPDLVRKVRKLAETFGRTEVSPGERIVR